MKIPIIFGWLYFHRKEQLCMGAGYKVKLACHWHKSSWKGCEIYSKRLFVIY